MCGEGEAVCSLAYCIMQRTGGDAKREIHKKASTAPLYTALTEVPVSEESHQAF